MSKRPFNKIRKIQKKQNVDLPDEQQQQPNLSREKDGGKPTIFNPGQKKKINIINPDALKNNEDNQLEPQKKVSLGSKPNLFKGKRQGGTKLIFNRESSSTANNELTQPTYGEAPKPTPLVIKKRPNFDLKNRQRENVVIQEEEQSFSYAPEQSKELNVEQTTNFRRKPDLKLKRLGPRSTRKDPEEVQEQSYDFSKSREESPFPSNQENVQRTPVHYREINIEPSTGISEGKIDKQKKRTNQLSHLLNLQTDLYEQMLSIGNVTPYEIYINKIKGGFLKNSSDQAFDEKVTNSSQTLSFQYAEFTNQCPQDYSIDVNKIERLDNEHLFDNFIMKMSPVIEELIQPSDTICEPPIFLLAFRPSFKAFLKCPYPTFIYHSEQFHLDLIVVGEKLYITEGQIESVLMIGKSIVAGLKNGFLILWNGQNSKTSRLYNQIKEYTNTTNFELPSFCTHHLEKYSPYASKVPIVSLLHQETNQFISLDQGGKIVRWEIETQPNGNQGLIPTSVIQLRNLVQRPSLQAFKIKQRASSYYISTSMGLLILQNGELRQKLENSFQEIIQFEIPKRTPLVYTITSSNSLHIYNQLYSHPLMSMNCALGSEKLTQIIVPELQHDNREIIIFEVIYLTDSAGRILEVKLLQNQFQPVKTMGEEDSDGRRDKNVIFRGVNRAGQTLQTLRLMRDLKVTKMEMRMDINTEKTVSNLKSIIEKNRDLMTLLEEQSVMMV